MRKEGGPGGVRKVRPWSNHQSTARMRRPCTRPGAVKPIFPSGPWRLTLPPPCSQVRRLIFDCFCSLYAHGDSISIYTRVNSLQTYLSSKEGMSRSTAEVGLGRTSAAGQQRDIRGGNRAGSGQAGPGGLAAAVADSPAFGPEGRE